MLIYEMAVLNDNWGLDPLAALEYVGQRENVATWLGLQPGAKLPGSQTSVVLAFVAADALEILRMPATLFLAPVVKRKIDAWRKG